MAMMDGTGEDDHLLIRGNSSNPGPPVPRRFLTAITGDDPIDVALGSGRLELARQINDPANPLTSRVIELHEGKINLESQPEKGAVFRITLPIEGPRQKSGEE